MVAKKRAFISFDIEHDEGAKKMLAGQAKLSDSPFDFKDNSLKEHLVGDWKQKVRWRMDNVDVVIILCGTKHIQQVVLPLNCRLPKKKINHIFCWLHTLTKTVLNRHLLLHQTRSINGHGIT